MEEMEQAAAEEIDQLSQAEATNDLNQPEN
jgi:hypothetical protein